jgi:hypothetical protein
MEMPLFNVSLTLAQWTALADAVARAPVPWLVVNPLLLELTRQLAPAQAAAAQVEATAAQPTAAAAGTA